MPEKTVTWWLAHHADVLATLAAVRCPGLRRWAMRRFVEALESWWRSTAAGGETWCAGRETVTVPFDPRGPFADPHVEASATTDRRTVGLRLLYAKCRVAIGYVECFALDGATRPDGVAWIVRDTRVGLRELGGVWVGGVWSRWPFAAQDACFRVLDDLIV